MSGLAIAALALLAAQSTAPASTCYRVETLALPDGVEPEVGGVAFLPDGRLAICTRRGEVWFLDLASKRWKRFASGLHEPLGILAGSPGEVIVAERPALTRVVDEDGDGVADAYLAITEDWGISGNYHEYAFGLTQDAEGNYWVGLGCASDAAGVFPLTRGPVNAFGRQGRMYSAVPYRGWILKVKPEGTVIPWASGFREPNGLCFDREGNLFATDNQGDWLGSSKLHAVREGAFHGHPSSLVWDPKFVGDPLAVPVSELDAMRQKEAAFFPQGKAANSPTQPLCDTTEGKFGPYGGQLLVGEITMDRILRVALEQVDGQFQGAVLPLIEGHGLNRGNNRLAFAADGTLYVGQSSRGWGTGAGLQRITWTGEMPLDLHHVALTRDGFDLQFTQPLASSASALASYSIQHFHYHYHRPYGSPEVDNTPVTVTRAELSADGRTVSLHLSELLPGKVYEIHVRNVKADAGGLLSHVVAYYTLQRLKD